jgi:hypothetical protein
MSSVVVELVQRGLNAPDPEDIAQWRADSETMLFKAPLALKVLHNADPKQAMAAAKELADAVLSVALRQPAAVRAAVDKAQAKEFTAALQEGGKHSSEPAENPPLEKTARRRGRQNNPPPIAQ